MKTIGIDPAPAKESVVFDGSQFLHLTPQELKNYVDKLASEEDALFVAWDAPLSAALDEQNFSLTIRKIERFFNRNGKHAKALKIPEGISTLGFASCPHWSISQYIFGHPIINPQFHTNIDFRLLSDSATLHSAKKGHFITEIHPALSIWLLLRGKIKAKEFQTSWKYKGDASKSTKKRLEIIIKHLLELPITQEYIDTTSLCIITDDELDAFVCWLMGKALAVGDKRVVIYGDAINGSFLLPYDAKVYEELQSYLA